ncbi:MAG: hypothetical protein KDC92_17750 [Bacteroidetes bacterium]|nr:hypothetical protein [Bacteroidota bacterium]
MKAKQYYRKPESVKKLEQLAFDDIKARNPNFPYPPKRIYRDDSTNNLTKCIVDWICLNGYQAERINSTGRRFIVNGAERWIKGSGTIGTADISATIRGRSVKIEVKCKATGDKYQSKHQKQYQQQIEQAGGVYIIARDFNQFIEWYNHFLNELKQ